MAIKPKHTIIEEIMPPFWPRYGISFPISEKKCVVELVATGEESFYI